MGTRISQYSIAVASDVAHPTEVPYSTAVGLQTTTLPTAPYAVAAVPAGIRESRAPDAAEQRHAGCYTSCRLADSRHESPPVARATPGGAPGSLSQVPPSQDQQ